MPIKTVAVLYGGMSAEREISLRSGSAVADGLTQAGFQVTLFDTKTRSLTELVNMNVDCAFIALHGRGGEDGAIQGALQSLNIPYTGSKVLGSALSMDKIRSKQVWKAMGLPTANFVIANKNDFQAETELTTVKAILSQLGNKVMVKPAQEGSSIGMAMATDEQTLRQALNSAFDYDTQVLVEAWINGPEYTVAILGDKALPVIEMQTPNTFYDFQAKYQSNTTQYHCPCSLSEEDEAALQALAVKAFKATNAEGWGRVDVMRDESGQWLLLEVNTVPGMTETSLVPKAAKVHGLSFSALTKKIIELSVAS